MASSGNDVGDRDAAEGASDDLRLTAPADASRQPRLPFPVVGIGASAGGLEAYIEFLKAAPVDGGMAYVLVQHLPPDRESLLADILGKHTRMPVIPIEDGQPVLADHVYIIRPGHTMTLRDGRLWLGAELAARGHSRPVDDFFRSLAEEQQQRAVAIVFSGMGSNGTAGAEAVKAVGGLVIAQDPESAKFPAMPRSLIDAGVADFVLRPDEVPEVLLRYGGHPYVRSDGPPKDVPKGDERALHEILTVLRARTRHDFIGYRKPTIVRRIQRRMGLTQFDVMGDYVKELRQSPGEATALADDLLIHVTGFFRDGEAWDSLREKVIEPLCAERPDGSAIRCWVAACATGEEAFTLAMLLQEAAEVQRKRLDIKVFATDMAERALGFARAGVFPGGIESEVTPERLNRFFDKDAGFYRIKRELRELVVFAHQNVLQDPPFSRLDIVTCRNLLIYLEPETQRRVVALLHFGLREGGTLMLGSSESVNPGDDLFEPLDKRHRIYRRVGPTRHGTLDFPLPVPSERAPTPPEQRHSGSSPSTIAQLAARALLEGHTPAAVVTDANGQVLYLHGDIGRYLGLTSGSPTHDLLTLCSEQMRGTVRTALHRAADTHEPVTMRDGLIEMAEGRRRVEVYAAPLGPRGAAPLYLVVFRDYPEPPPPPPRPDENGADDRRLVEELSRTRDELQTALEEMQTSKEELKASHEETTSINEELQSTNEELETSKEELQSLNEELVTVNAQLQTKMSELEATSNDLTSLLASTDIAVLFLDTSFRIRRFTPAVRELLDLISTDVGRPLAALARRFDDPHLDEDCRGVLDRLIPVEREIAGASGRFYLRRVLPYRTADNRIDGVVVAFVDVTARRRAEDAVRAGEERLRRMLNIDPVGVLVFDAAGTLIEANDSFLKVSGYTRAEIAARTLTWRTFTPPEYLAESERQMQLLADTGRIGPYEKEFIQKDGTRRWMMLAGATLEDGTTVKYCIDVTAKKQAEAGLRASEERLRLILESATDYGVLTMNIDRVVTSWSSGAAAIFGYAAEEILGRSADILFTPDDRAAGQPEREAAAARATGRAADERWHLRKTGDRFFASGVLTPFGPGGSFGFVKVLRDLTDRKQMEDQLRAAKDELEARVAERTAALEAEMGRRRELARQLTSSQENERLRVSRDLHDTAGQLLIGLSLAVAKLRREPGLAPTAAAQAGEVARMAESLSKELHALALRLRPTALDDFGLATALAELVKNWSAHTGVATECDVDSLGVERLPPEVETTIYRVVQEALTNAAKHAQATRVSVVLSRTENEARVAVEDDGRGFDPGAVGRDRLGLAGMRERVELLGGTLEIESSSESGTTVLARIPLPKQI